MELPIFKIKIDNWTGGGNGYKVVFSSNNMAHKSSLTKSISADISETNG